MSQLVPIGKVAEVNPTIPKILSDSSDKIVTFLPMAAVSEEGRIIAPEESSISAVIKGYRYFEQGDVLLAKITPCMENGKAVFVEDIPYKIGFGSTEFHVLRPSSNTDGRYLFYMVWNPIFRYIAERNMTGTAGQRRVPTDFVKSYKIPHPPLEEQRRIAAILNKADAVRRKRQQAIALTEELLRSAFLEMFGDPITNPKGWAVDVLENFGQIITGNTPPRTNLQNYGNLIEWMKSDNITTPSHFLTGAAEKLSYHGKKIGRVVPARSVLVVCIAGSRSSIGRAALTDREVAFNQQINAVVPNSNVDPYFLYSQFFIAQELVQSQSTNSMKGLVSKSKFSSIQFIKPPEQKQREFGNWFLNFHKWSLNLHKDIQLSNNLFNSLLQKAFNGEI